MIDKFLFKVTCMGSFLKTISVCLLFFIAIFCVSVLALYMLVNYKILDIGIIGKSIEVIKFSVEIAFFCTVMTITVLSYLQAKKTLFTPIKTEIFKLQITHFEKIFTFFQNKSDYDFMVYFDISNMRNINVEMLLYDYIAELSPKKSDLSKIKEQQKKVQSKAVGMFVKQSYAEKNLQLVSPVESKHQQPEDKKKPWSEYECGVVLYTEQYATALKELEGLIHSPLLTEDLKNELIAFEKIINATVADIYSSVTEISQKLPKLMPGGYSGESISVHGLWQTIDRSKNFSYKKIADRVLSSVKDYLQIEDIIKS